MPARDDLIAIPDELLRNGNIGQAALVFMDFRDSPQRWWTGFGDLNVAGQLWRGLGDLISISEIETSYQVSAQQVSFEVAATQEMLALALDAKNRVRDRAVTVYLQLFAMDDVGLRRGVNQLYGKGRALSDRRTIAITKLWMPYRSIASWYLWRLSDPAAPAAWA